MVRTEPVEGGRVEVSFVDTGCGIPQENLEKIFEPFYTTKERGTGLGLAITTPDHRAAPRRDHHRKRTGQGTTVPVTLPIEHEEL